MKYIDAQNRFEKSLVVHAVVEQIRSVGGRFLKRNEMTGNWCELSDQQSKEKVGHAIRDAVSSFEARKERKRKLMSRPGGEESSKAMSLEMKQADSIADSAASSEEGKMIAISESGDGRYTHHQTSSLQSAWGLSSAVMQQMLRHENPLQLPQLPQPTISSSHHLGAEWHAASELVQHSNVDDKDAGDAKLLSVSSIRLGAENDFHDNDHFLEQINQVLGPLPPGAEDPMGPLFNRGQQPP